MKIALILFVLSGCAHNSQEKKVWKPEVSVNAALNQAQMSYLLGCVEAFKKLKQSPSFNHCKDLAVKHRFEIEKIMHQKILD
jgi:hypothetical protein